MLPACDHVPARDVGFILNSLRVGRGQRGQINSLVDIALVDIPLQGQRIAAG